MRISDWSSDVCSSDLPEHDYMGFATTREAFYSSGHPAAGSNLINPFGLIKSTDAGKTWRQLGLEGESDFHTLATSYETNAVYVLNYGPNTRMPQAGLYMTQTDGQAWTRAAANGLKRSEEHTSELKSLMRISYAVL